MKKTQLVLEDSKKSYTLTVQQMTIYLQSQIIEAIDEQANIYYMIFYKNQYVNTYKASRIRCNSHIANSLKHGTTFPANHPLIIKCLSSKNHYRRYTFNSLLPKLQKEYTPHETALILTFFESFIPRKNLFQEIQNIYYEFRRNGQMFSGYRILQLLQDFVPRNKWMKQTIHLLDYMKYAQFYDSADSLRQKDQLHYEKILSQHIDEKNHYSLLSSLLAGQSRHAYLIALSIRQWEKSPDTPLYRELLHLLTQYMTASELTFALEDLLQRAPHCRALQSDLFDHYFKTKNYISALQLLAEHKLKLSVNQAEKLEVLINNMDFKKHSSILENLVPSLIPLFIDFPDKADELLRNCVCFMLDHYGIAEIMTWIKPLQSVQPPLSIVKQMEEMAAFSDNPDRQSLLGELFYQFKQYEKAIDCFSWEMELKSNDPEPVKWLSKTYAKMGKQQEAAVYQQLSIDMYKRA